MKIVEETSRGRLAGEGHSKREAPAVPSSPGAGHARKKSSQFCHMFASTGRCKWRDCIFVHDAHPADSSSPASLSGGGGGNSASAGGGARASTLRASMRLELRVAAGLLGAAAQAPDGDTGPSVRLGRHYLGGVRLFRTPAGR